MPSEQCPRCGNYHAPCAAAAEAELVTARRERDEARELLAVGDLRGAPTQQVVIDSALAYEAEKLACKAAIERMERAEADLAAARTEIERLIAHADALHDRATTEYLRAEAARTRNTELTEALEMIAEGSVACWCAHRARAALAGAERETPASPKDAPYDESIADFRKRYAEYERQRGVTP